MGSGWSGWLQSSFARVGVGKTASGGPGAVVALSWASGTVQAAVAVAAVDSADVVEEIDYQACMPAAVVGVQCHEMSLDLVVIAADGELALSVGAVESAVAAVEEAEVAFGIVKAEDDGEPGIGVASVVAVVACVSVVIVCEYVATAAVVPFAVLGPG